MYLQHLLQLSHILLPKNIDLKTVEKEFVELEKEATKLATEFPVFDDLFTQLIIKNFTPK